jgi:hypothetical protein
MTDAGAFNELEQLRFELAAAREHTGKVEIKARAAEAKAARVLASNTDLVARNAHLELMNARMRRGAYGTSSERSRRLLDQLELVYEEAEADAAETEMLAALAAARTTHVCGFGRCRPCIPI